MEPRIFTGWRTQASGPQAACSILSSGKQQGPRCFEIGPRASPGWLQVGLGYVFPRFATEYFANCDWAYRELRGDLSLAQHTRSLQPTYLADSVVRQLRAVVFLPVRHHCFIVLRPVIIPTPDLLRVLFHPVVLSPQQQLGVATGLVVVASRWVLAPRRIHIVDVVLVCA